MADPTARTADDLLGPAFTLPSWGDGSSWSDESSYSTIQFSTIAGAGVGVLLGRSPAGLETWQFTRYPDYSPLTGYWHPLDSNPNFSNANGWDAPKYYETIQTADITGSGTKHLLARSDVGLETWEWTPEGNTWVHLATDDDYSDHFGWDDPQFYETIQTTDADTSERPAMLVARGGGGIVTRQWDNTSNTWQTLSVYSPAWSDDAGWDYVSAYSTIQTGDITGDGTAELIGRGPEGLEIYSWDGANSGWFQLYSDASFADAHGWDEPQYYETIQTGDVTGDGSAELLARGAEGLIVMSWDWNSSTLTQVSVDTNFSDANGWDHAEFYETIQTADVTGDGAAELLARDHLGLNTYRLDPTTGTWTELATGSPAMSNDAGWDHPSRYLTITPSTDYNPGFPVPLVARDGVGLRTWFYDAGAWSLADDIGFPAFDAAQQRAYAVVNATIGVPDLRSTYDTTETGDLSTSLTILRTMSSPNAKNLTRAEWNALKDQLTDELTWAIRAIDHYQTLAAVLDHTTMADDLGLHSIVTAIDANPSSDHVIDVVVGTMAAAITDAVIEAALTTAGGPVGALAGAMVATAWSLSVDDMFDSDTSGTVSELETILANDFQDALSGMQTALSAQTTNYGLLLPVGSMLDADPIPTPQQQAMRAAHLRAWTAFAYQVAANAERDGHAPTYGVAGCGDDDPYHNSCSDYEWNPPAGAYQLDYGPGALWLIQFKLLGADNVDDTINERLFGSVSDSCRTEFTSGCNLGLDKSTVMFDWGLRDCWSVDWSCPP
ncbi:MAG: VCBS repeat-containing protein [Acidimicrobiia bacterium]|nr:VCBS repeat-containing protein [Acidimicrobiia bacterium]